MQAYYQDDPVLTGVEWFIKDIKPHGVVLNGDIVDCYSISDFDRNPMEEDDLDREIRVSTGLLERLAKVTKERFWVGGNHEDRLRRHVWRHRESFKKLGRRFLESADFPQLFRLGDSGFKWEPYGGHVMLGNLMVTHGNMVSKHSAQTARSHFDKYGTSILIGHTHRVGWYAKTNIRGVHGAWEGGCLCRLNPEYVQHPDWQQAVTVVHVDEDNWFNVQVLPILDRKTFFYGKDRYRIRGT